jgi:hypothetical protein
VQIANIFENENYQSIEGNLQAEHKRKIPERTYRRQISPQRKTGHRMN